MRNLYDFEELRFPNLVRAMATKSVIRKCLTEIRFFNGQPYQIGRQNVYENSNYSADYGSFLKRA